MSLKILIVDDEPNICFLLEQVLEDLEEDYGAEILIAANGRDGLNLIRNEHPDLVFLDVMMPIMSGLEVCKTIRNEPDICETPVIMLTAKGQASDRDSGFSSGASLYLTKPFNPKEVLEKTLDILSKNEFLKATEGV